MSLRLVRWKIWTGLLQQLTRSSKRLLVKPLSEIVSVYWGNETLNN